MLKKVTVSFLLGSALTLSAQLPPPIAPEQIVYRHWPESFIQWLGPELPYTMMELYVDPGAGPTPLYDAVLTDRASGKRIHYSNQQQMVDVDKRSGGEAYLTNMQLDRPASASSGATYLLRFVDHAGQPVSWQFIQGSDISERGGGSSPAGIDPPVLMYRERGAVAGEGTALKIGNAVSVADVWSEISHPPFFVAYHGAMSQNVDMAVFAAAAQQWTTISAPKALTSGAEWKLKADDGVDRTLHVQAVNADHATVLDTDDHFPGRTVTLDAVLTNGAWSFEKLHYAAASENANQGLTLTFSPGISGGGSSKFELIAGRKTRIASGTVHADSEQPRIGWDFKDPGWLKGKIAWVRSQSIQQTTAVAKAGTK